jgi:endonuclease/exonuclease/phosphatase family metal-dependent hydrolase
LTAQGLLIKEFNYDVVCLQEVDRFTRRSPEDQVKTLSAITNLPNYIFFKAVNLDGGEYGLGFLSKHKVLTSLYKSFTQRSDLEQRIIYAVRIEHKNRNKWIFNTHFSHIDENTQFNASVQTIDFYRSIKREYPNDDYLLFGDLNVTPGSRTERNLMKVFTDFWVKCGNGNGNTFDSKNPHKRIDYILTDKNNLSCSMRVINSIVSDHRKVFLDVNL